MPSALSHSLITDAPHGKTFTLRQGQYTIGETAAAAGVTRRAVRLYESRGLLRAPARTSAGYRLYTQRDIDILSFIRRARCLGLSLEAIAEIIDISEHGAPCARTRALLAERIAEIDETINDLQRLRDTINTARGARVDQTSAARCAVIEHATTTS